MKIITWNINSIRLRIGHLKTLLEQQMPDIVCLQEIKVADEFFPLEEVKAIGYEHVYFAGQKSYNGVAILSRVAVTNVQRIKFVNEDTRHISVMLPGNIEVHNFYIPSGGDEPDPLINQKFDHKLKYLDAVEYWLKTEKSKNDKIILVGDLNIAPLDNDVWSHKQLINEVSHTAIEIEKLDKIYNSLEFVDALRKFVPASEKLYSWWSYRNRDWKKSNRGRRLDHIWTTPVLNDNIKTSYILKEARDWVLPSDHVPVVLELK